MWTCRGTPITVIPAKVGIQQEEVMRDGRPRRVVGIHPDLHDAKGVSVMGRTQGSNVWAAGSPT